MALKIGEEQAVQMPMKTVASLIAMVAIGTWAFFGIQETLNQHSTKLELMSSDLEKNTEFRIKWPRGELGSLPADSEQFLLIEDLYKSTEKLTKNQEMNTSNKLRIEFMEKQITKMLNDIEKLNSIEWNCVVLDEAQAIKNPKSYTAQAAFKLNSKFRLTLTGTPIENRLNELWSQMHFLCPGLLAGSSDFQKTYEQPIAQGAEAVAKKLRDKIKPFVLRRLKKDVTPELPPRTDQILHCTLSSEERNIYDAVRASAQEKIVKQLEEGSLNVMSALEALLRLRQAACHIGLLPGIESDSSSKIDMLVEKLEEVLNSGHKALVFSQWTSLLDKIEPILRRKSMDYVRLDGATRDRQAVVEAFQKKDGVPIFLASLKAGGTGLNLTEADHVFLVDPWWNPAVEDQAADRAHRIGQEKPVIVYRLVAQDSVEERILVLQDKKRALADAALGVGSQGLSVTKEDLLALLE